MLKSPILKNPGPAAGVAAPLVSEARRSLCKLREQRPGCRHHLGWMQKLHTLRGWGFQPGSGTDTAGEGGMGSGWRAEARADLCEPFRESKGCEGRNGVDVQLPFSANTVMKQIPLVPPGSNSTRCVSPRTQSSVTKTSGRASAERACALTSQCLVSWPNSGGFFLGTIRGSSFLAVFSLLFYTLFTNLKALL